MHWQENAGIFCGFTLLPSVYCNYAYQNEMKCPLPGKIIRHFDIIQAESQGEKARENTVFQHKEYVAVFINTCPCQGPMQWGIKLQVIKRKSTEEKKHVVRSLLEAVLRGGDNILITSYYYIAILTCNIFLGSCQVNSLLDHNMTQFKTRKCAGLLLTQCYKNSSRPNTPHPNI